MVVAGTKDAVLMVESEASELSEEVMLGGVMYAHEQFQVVIDNVAEFAKEVGIAPREWVAPADNETLLTSIKSKFEVKLLKLIKLLIRWSVMKKWVKLKMLH